MSPLQLLQEIYRNDPWRIMVACILLNRTKRKQVDGIRDYLFKKYPTARKMSKADPVELAEILRPLGFYNRRAKTLIDFSIGWLGDWKDVSELKGIGQYARDSWSLFVDNEMVDNPSDHVLKDYVKWLKDQSSCTKPDR